MLPRLDVVSKARSIIILAPFLNELKALGFRIDIHKV